MEAYVRECMQEYDPESISATVPAAKAPNEGHVAWVSGITAYLSTLQANQYNKLYPIAEIL